MKVYQYSKTNNRI